MASLLTALRSTVLCAFLRFLSAEAPGAAPAAPLVIGGIEFSREDDIETLGDAIFARWKGMCFLVPGARC